MYKSDHESGLSQRAVSKSYHEPTTPGNRREILYMCVK